MEMNPDQPSASHFCSNCGQPLTQEETEPAEKCAKCSAVDSPLGLAPGAQWHEMHQAGSLGEIGSWAAPGAGEREYRLPHEETPSKDIESQDDGHSSRPMSTPARPEEFGHYSPPQSGAAGFDRWVTAEGGYGPPGMNPPHAPWGEAFPSSPPDADRPPWGLFAALGVWLFSVAAIIVAPNIAIGVWVVFQRLAGAAIPQTTEKFMEWVTTDPQAVLVEVLSFVAAHLVTILVFWAVVTHLGKRPFWATIGWSWENVPAFATLGMLVASVVFSFVGIEIWKLLSRPWRMGFGVGAAATVLIFYLIKPTVSGWSKIGFVTGIVAMLFVFEEIASALLPESKGDSFEQLLRASQTVRIVITVIAVLSAPIVEEGVYRGVLYSGLRKVAGLWPSIVIVTALFAGVHFIQYWGSWATIVSITVLSFTLTVVRARTKSLLPCVAIHMLFNSVSSVFILLHKY
jgi:membrane protease YdiL (CAAX protease family)